MSHMYIETKVQKYDKQPVTCKRWSYRKLVLNFESEKQQFINTNVMFDMCLI